MTGAKSKFHWHPGDVEISRPPSRSARTHAADPDDTAGEIGLSKAVSEDAKAATAAHLLETTLHELTHGSRHAQQMAEDEHPDGPEFAFNADHAEKHLGGAAEHAAKLRDHFADNYPGEAKWLKPEDNGADSGKLDHARYSKRDGGTISAQMANGETITGQLET